MTSSAKRFKILLSACAALAVCAFVYLFDPEHTRWFPKCPFYMLTGWQCPSCGTSRALYHMLHGEFIEGIGYNPFILVSWPLLSVAIYLLWRNDTKYIVNVLWIYVALFFIWLVFRNLAGV